MKNCYHQTFYLLMTVLLPLNTQALFHTSKRQNFYALNKPIMLPPNPIPGPMQLPNQVHRTAAQMVPHNWQQRSQILNQNPGSNQLPIQNSQLTNAQSPQNGPLPTSNHQILQQIPQNGQPSPTLQIPPNGQSPPTFQIPPNGQPPPTFQIPPNGQSPPTLQMSPNGQLPPPLQMSPNGQLPPPLQIPQNGHPFPQFFATAPPQKMNQFFPQQQPNSIRFGKQPIKNAIMHHLHPPKKGPLPVGPIPIGSAPMRSVVMPHMVVTPPNSNNRQKMAIASTSNNYNMGIMKGLVMAQPPDLSQGSTAGQWVAANTNFVTPNVVSQMDDKEIQILQPMASTSQPVVGTSTISTTTTDAANTSLLPVLAVDNVTFPMSVITDRIDQNSTNENKIIFTHEDSWIPIISEEFEDHPVQFVMSPSIFSSNESGENLPDSQPLIGPHPMNVMPVEPSSKLDSIKRGIYGLLFGRKGPPEVEFRARMPPRIPTKHMGPPGDSRWRPIENKLQMMANRRQHDEKITCKLFTSDVCLEVNDYPFEIIINELMRNAKTVNAMYADVPIQDLLELMDGISSKSELSYTYQHYFGNDNAHSHRDYGQEGGNVCPSETIYAKPRRGRNIKGEWKYIINVPQFPQTIRLERCLKPKSKCNYIDPFVQSQCSQLHTLQRTLVWTVERGLHIDVLMFPSACSCYLLPINNNKTSESNDIPLEWDEDTMLMDETVQLSDIIKNRASNNTPTRKLTRTPNLLGPYTRTLHKYSRDDLVNKDRRPHTNFGRPLVSEKGYLDGEEGKINYNQHSTSDYIQPWN